MVDAAQKYSFFAGVSWDDFKADLLLRVLFLQRWYGPQPQPLSKGSGERLTFWRKFVFTLANRPESANALNMFRLGELHSPLHRFQFAGAGYTQREGKQAECNSALRNGRNRAWQILGVFAEVNTRMK